ncbi:uncharacterized protein LOC143459644 [Clavelina lepadiformis]|uniref:uncharacterized protein LOC143459644 n=1 Tax=Clavelina lepadiformis TaxID=159417 RepID=UPI004041A156
MQLRKITVVLMVVLSSIFFRDCHCVQGNNSSDVDSHSSKSNSTATTVPTKTSLKLGLRNDIQWCRFLDKFAKMCDRSVKTRNYLIEKCGSYKQPLIALRCTKCRYIMKFCDGQARIFEIRN